MFVVFCLLFADRSLLFVVCSLLCVAWCFLLAVFVRCCLSRHVCCPWSCVCVFFRYACLRGVCCLMLVVGLVRFFVSVTILSFSLLLRLPFVVVVVVAAVGGDGVAAVVYLF